MIEAFKPIPGYEGLYEVSDKGTVRGIRRDIIRKPILTANGNYFKVTLSKNSELTDFQVSRLILMAFVGEPPEGNLQCRHLDGNSHNNSLDNLTWDSLTENGKDKVSHVPSPINTKNDRSRLLPKIIRSIRNLLTN